MQYPHQVKATLLILTVLMTGSHLLAQDEDLRVELFFDTVDVNVVNIEVLVTDKDGNPVRGLERDDFEVYEDGRLVDLTNFFAVENREAVMTGLGMEGEIDDEFVPSPKTKRLNLVVFVDNLNITPASRNVMFDSLREYLTTELDPRDQVMLVTMNDAVQVTQEFTNDLSLLLAALDRLEKQVGRHAQYEADHRRLIRTIQSARLFPRPVGLESQANFESAVLDAERTAFDVRQLAERKVQKATATCEALSAFTESLAGMQGRKAVLNVSDGLQTRPADSRIPTIRRLGSG
jgi:VWFA-related protein